MTTAEDSNSTTPPLRILHVISSLDARAGGTTTALAALALAQGRAGLRVSVVSTYAPGADMSTAEQLRGEGIEVHLIGPTRRPLAWHSEIGPTLRRLIARADVVHIHALWEEIQHRAAAVARATGKPYIISPHGMLDPWSLSQGGLKKRLYLSYRLRADLNGADAIHYADEVECDLARANHPDAPGFVQRHVVDLTDFADLPPRGVFRAKHPQIGERPIVLFMSRIHPKKGLDLLVPAFAKAKLPDVMLVIAGPDNDGYASTVRASAIEQGVGDRVIFPGMLRGRERVEAMVDADLFVLPSYQENFGIVVIEALASGLPVVISDAVNIHRTILAERLGEVVPTKVDPLAAAVERWMNDPQLRRDVAARAPEFVRSHYSGEHIGPAWVGLYARIVMGEANSLG